MGKMLARTLTEILPILVVMGSSLITVGILTIIGKVSLGAFLAIVGGWLGVRGTKESARVMIEAGKYRITGEGIGVGILIAGILIILSVILSELLASLYPHAVRPT